MQIGFLTSSSHPELTQDDQLLAAAFRDNGHVARPVIWSQWDGTQPGCAAIVIRSPWDYHLRPAEFVATLREIDVAGVVLINPLELVLWNLDKVYLRELQNKGVRIPRTVFLEGGAAVPLAEIMRTHRFERAVIKPRISATAYRTWVVSEEELSRDAYPCEERFSSQLAARGLLVQEYVPQIAEGEWSLMFFDGNYSHSVLKVPKRGDFRVQSDFGGSALQQQVATPVLQQAEHILRLLPSLPGYCRLDGVAVDGQFILMEAELIEPSLFFWADTEAPNRAMRSILRRIERQRQA